jgi:hypothetical protein
MRSFTRCAITLAITALAVACSSADDGDDDAQGQPQNNALTCIAGELHPCACLGQATIGMQSCNITGNGYGVCTGCPAPSAAGSGGMSGAVNTGGTIADAGKPETGGTGGIVDAGKHDAAVHEDSSVSLPGGAEPGVSCGVGLPALCELTTEKCCVRSLQTDSCIAADASCDCAVDGCMTMEAHCDGPEDCASGEVCCGTLAQSGDGYEDFVCAATCAATGNQRQACHDGETECPQGLECANSQLLTNVQICIDPASIEQ